MCKYKDTGHGPCGGPDNGLYCMNHQDCRKGQIFCGHRPAEQKQAK